MPSDSDFLGSLIFGSIGLAAMVYGKKAYLPKKMIMGGLLMAYPYIIPQPWMMWPVGVLLTVVLSVWKD